MFCLEKGKYERLANAEVVVPGSEQILNLVATDFDHDGFLDVLVMSGSRDADEFALTGYKNNIFLGNGKTLSASGWVLPASYTQLMPFDYNGHMQVDLLGGLQKASTGGRLEVLASNGGGPNMLATGFKRESFEPAFECPTGGPQWNAFADVNGDGRADLILTCAKPDGVDLVILHATADNGYSLAWRRTLPPTASQMTVVDIDADGSPDIVYTVCEQPDSCVLNILYSGQPPFCTGSRKHDKGVCRSNALHFSSASGDAGFELDGPRHQQIPLGQILKGAALLRVDPHTRLPIPLAFGDYDLDGFPDLLLTVESSSPAATHAVLLRNLRCDGTPRIGCRADASKKNTGASTARRTFLPEFEHVEALGKEVGVTQAAFADIRGKGSLSILCNGYHPGSDKPKFSAFSNDAFNDAFFVRAESLNGVCPAPCSRKATGSKASEPYGVNYSGAAFRLSFTDIDGAVRVRSGSQLAQTGNRALHQPFVIFGLGRTNSFVDLFSASCSSRHPSSSPSHSQPHIVPNSDLILIPPHADSPSDWSFHIHIHPAAHFVWVMAALGTALTLLATLTAFFKMQERREDEAEKRKRAHAINFDAM